MLFNSFEFLLFFLPICIALYFVIIKWGKLTLARYWLLCASLFFYSWWNPIYLPLIVASILFNYFTGRALNKASKDSTRRGILWGGVVLNIGLLGYFKYFNFFINNVNLLVQNQIHVSQIILPLGISFFTFQQVAYLVDSFYGKTKEYDFVSYSLFVTFFPQLIAGPIVHHKDVMPQFDKVENQKFNAFNFSKGLYVFFMGLAKKFNEAVLA